MLAPDVRILVSGGSLREGRTAIVVKPSAQNPEGAATHCVNCGPDTAFRLGCVEFEMNVQSPEALQEIGVAAERI